VGKSIYVTSSEGHSGKSSVALGIVDTLNREVGRVGVFRPIVAGGSNGDAVLELLLQRHDASLGLTYDDSWGVTYDDVHDDPEAALATIVTKFRDLERRCDVVVVVGSDYTDVGNPAELGFNVRVAANLGAPILLVLTGRNPDDLSARTADQMRQVVENTLPEISGGHAHVLGIAVNRAGADDLDRIREAVAHTAERIEGRPIPTMALPEMPLLIAPTVQQIMDAVDGRLYSIDPASLEREVLDVVIAGMSMEHVLTRLIEGSAVVIAADRTETLLSVLLSQQAEGFPSIAAIVVNGPFEFSPVIQQLLGGLKSSVPIIRTDLGTYPTAQRMHDVRGRLSSGARRKVDLALSTFETHVRRGQIRAFLDVERSNVVTPMMFEYGLLERARSSRKRIVLPEGGDDRILKAASTLLTRNVADLTILGEESEVRARAAAIGADISAADVLSPHDPALVARFAEEYARLRAHKGMTVDAAAERVQDVSYFGTMMVHLGLADGMVSGAAHTTAHTIRPGFEIVKTKPGTGIVSSVFLMALADRVLVYGDCAVNPDPTAEQLADIAISSAETAAQFGIEPRIAMLSYSTGESGSGADVDKVREATRLVHERRPDLLVEGPIQYDAATDMAVATKKMPGSEVAGRATVFIFPDLNTGNNTYKAVQRVSGGLAVGPVLQGLAKPINDLSRGALVSDIVNTVAITAIQAQEG